MSCTIKKIEPFHIDAGAEFLRNITPDPATAKAMSAAFLSLAENHRDDDTTLALIWDIQQVSQEKNVAFDIDWKDKESFRDFITDIAAHWGCAITLSDDDIHNENIGIWELIGLAHDQLTPHGLGIWCWNDGDDNYSGWIGRLSDTMSFNMMAELIGAKIASGGVASPYGDVPADVAARNIRDPQWLCAALSRHGQPEGNEINLYDCSFSGDDFYFKVYPDWISIEVKIIYTELAVFWFAFSLRLNADEVSIERVLTSVDEGSNKKIRKVLGEAYAKTSIGIPFTDLSEDEEELLALALDEFDRYLMRDAKA
ncbi:MAG: hypothetical protein LBE62_11650 [Azonexus sp.]|jgi:hypothetical protein|nr:hypothetical protein [Azonexus sp.]